MNVTLKTVFRDVTAAIVTLVSAKLVDRFVNVTLSFVVVLVGCLVLIYLHELHKPISLAIAKALPVAIPTMELLLVIGGMLILVWAKFYISVPHLTWHAPKPPSFWNVKSHKTLVQKVPSVERLPKETAPRLGEGPDAYKDLDAAQVGQWTMEEADKIERMGEEALNPIPGIPVSSNSRNWMFTNRFNDCCADDVKQLRTEVLRRLGPAAKDTDEISAWIELFPDFKYPIPRPPIFMPSSATHYAPYLRRLGLRLKRQEVPRSSPKALQFSEQQLSPEKAGSSRIVVTIKTRKELLAGYIAVQFSRVPYEVEDDFENSSSALKSADFIDNQAVVEILRVSTNFILRIGKTPFVPSKAIHVEVRASAPIHVSAVTFFDE
jgi:hypothetical protein